MRKEIENPLNEKEWKEKMFRKQIAESTRKMIETLTIAEQMRVSFVPLIIIHASPVLAEILLMLPSSSFTPGSAVNPHKPLISGADTSSTL